MLAVYLHPRPWAGCVCSLVQPGLLLACGRAGRACRQGLETPFLQIPTGKTLQGHTLWDKECLSVSLNAFHFSRLLWRRKTKSCGVLVSGDPLSWWFVKLLETHSLPGSLFGHVFWALLLCFNCLWQTTTLNFPEWEPQPSSGLI